MLKMKKLTHREKWLGGFALLFFALFIGDIAAKFASGLEIKADMISAIVAAIALPIAIAGYLDTRHSQQMEHRAYVAIQTHEPQLIIGKKPRFKFSFVNSGRTPAYNTALSVGIVVEAVPTMDKPSKAQADTPLQKGICLHTGVSESVSFNADFAPSQKMLDDIFNEIVTITIVVRLEYEDSFGNPHITQEVYCVPSDWAILKDMSHASFGSIAT